jgi:hypothetical protein
MSASISAVDLALDKYIQQSRARGIDPTGVFLGTLSAFARVTNSWMSQALQDYRKAQSAGPTRYVIACEGYGISARWRILAKPGNDPSVIREARRIHGLYIVRDAVQRYVRDRVTELQSSLTQSQQDREIEFCVNLIEGQFTALLQHVESRLTP